MKKLPLCLIKTLSISLILFLAGSCEFTEVDEDPVPEPQASFTFNVDSSNPLQVSFLNTSNDADSFIWSFGDGNGSSEKNPSHIYDQSGSYEVKLVAIGEGGTSETTSSLRIKETAEVDAPTASFSFSINDFSVSFTNESSNATSYSWNFGDGTSSSVRNPSKTYAENGNYTVSLTAVGEGGSTTTNKQVSINVVATVTLPDSYLGNWYNVNDVWIYAISEDSGGKYIRTGNINYYYDPSDDVSRLDVNGIEVYEITASNGSTNKSFWLKQDGNANRIKVSRASSTSGFDEFGHVVGRSVVRATIQGGAEFIQTGSSTWEERRSNGTVNATFTEDSRDDWSVYLTKSDGAKLQIGVWGMVIRITPVGGTKRDLYEIEEVFR